LISILVPYPTRRELECKRGGSSEEFPSPSLIVPMSSHHLIPPDSLAFSSFTFPDNFVARRRTEVRQQEDYTLVEKYIMI